MSSLRKRCTGRRFGLVVLATPVLALLLVIGQPDTPRAKANLPCDVATGPANAITGILGAGSPVSDACNTVTRPIVAPITRSIAGGLASLGTTIFGQIATWVSQGATWLISQVVKVINQTTTPDLLSRGFVAQYRQMAEIAAALAAAMLLLTVLEGLARGNAGMLARVVLVNLPLAFIATSAAYVIVQLLLVTTDGLSHVVATSTARHTHDFFQGAENGLSVGGATGGAAGGLTAGGAGAPVGAATGAAEVPLFVTIIVAIIGALAAFFVWIELLMRDAAVYVVALFLPMALAASIWPRWTGALRRTAELLVVVIASKFVIVSIIALAAGLLANGAGRVEHVMAAGALLLLACFSPFVLLRLVPFTEGALAASPGRRDAADALPSRGEGMSATQIVGTTARGNWVRGAALGGGEEPNRISGWGGAAGWLVGDQGSSGAAVARRAAASSAMPGAGAAVAAVAAGAGKGAAARLGGAAVGAGGGQAQASTPAGQTGAGADPAPAEGAPRPSAPRPDGGAEPE